MIQTITIPDADERLKIAINKRAKRSGSVELDENRKFACVILKFNEAVTPANYPLLKTEIEALSGIQEVCLLVDGQVPAIIPAGTAAILHLNAQLRIDDISTPPE